MMHDGMHFALSSTPWINVTCAYLGSAHMSITGWISQHVIGHHSHTNLVNADPDLYHFSFLAHAGIPGWRTTKAQRAVEGGAWYWRLGLCLRVPFTTAGPSLMWEWANWTVFNQSFLGMVPQTPSLRPARLTLHLVGRLALLAFAFVYPLTWWSAEGVRQAHLYLHSSEVGLEGAAQTVGTASQTQDELVALRSLRAGQLICLGILKGILFSLLPYAIHGTIFYIFSQVLSISATIQ